jgi:mannose-6-phosphate isomerase
MNTKNIIKPYLLYNQIQPYEWGTRGKQAYIPNLLEIPTEENKPYAELWMGTHPAAPSQIDFDGGLVELHKVIKTYPVEILGVKTYAHFGANLPFLFKVLSAGQALSIQAHPNRQQAIQLHSNDPQHYPDQNHKPEIAIALDELTVLLGLLDPPELIKRLGVYPEVQRVTGITSINIRMDFGKNHTSLIKQFYSNLIQKSASDSEHSVT